MRPTETISPSPTAITAEPARACTSMPLRFWLDTTGLAAFSPAVTFFASRAVTWSSYVACAATGKCPWVRPDSEETRSVGMAAMSWARSRTSLTYQSAWL